MKIAPLENEVKQLKARLEVELKKNNNQAEFTSYDVSESDVSNRDKPRISGQFEKATGKRGLYEKKLKALVLVLASMEEENRALKREKNEMLPNFLGTFERLLKK